jgi:hypothetical protein
LPNSKMNLHLSAKFRILQFSSEIQLFLTKKYGK